MRRNQGIVNKHLVPFFDGPLASICMEDVTKYMTMRLKTGDSNDTVLREIGVLHRILVLAVKKDYLDKNPMDKMDADEFPSPLPGRKVFLQPEQFLLIQAKVKPEEYRHVYTFLVNTGCRRSDAVGDPRDGKEPLLWPNVYLEDSVIRIPLDKRGREKIIPLNRTLVSMLKSLPRRAGDDRVFWFAPDPDYVSQMWREARDAAGFPHVTLHDLKHTAYSLMRKTGAEIDTIARVAGQLGYEDGNAVRKLWPIAHQGCS